MNTRTVEVEGKRSWDRFFFPGMAVFILGTVFLGFAKSYFLAGVFRAPLASWILHVHGAMFSSWVLLLIVQTSLIATDRIDLHRRLGLAGFGLASLMILVGISAGLDSLRRGFGGFANDPRTFFVFPISDMLIFGSLVFFAYRARFNPPAHKRLILVATVALMDAAVARWPFAFIQDSPFWVTELCTYGFLATLLMYDLWTTRKVHSVTLWASAFLIFVQRVRLPIGETAAWHAFAGWAQNLVRVVHNS